MFSRHRTLLTLFSLVLMTLASRSIMTAVNAFEADDLSLGEELPQGVIVGDDYLAREYPISALSKRNFVRIGKRHFGPMFKRNFIRIGR
ncbi:unnamed protein product [Echinostoma caproni]|uniref:Uncharacterized protein n=1 Tax=Echinostoma caproni TaxID=27848 RepID=A0A183AGH5_9TREM|nr:unnamed protein product [Echinostoma caproni]